MSAGRDRGFLSQLSAPVFDRLSGEAVQRRYTDGQQIHARGEETPGFSMVRKGKVRMGTLGQSGTFVEFGILHAGDVFGDVLILARVRRLLDAYAIGPTVVDHILPDRFERLLDELPELQRLLLRMTAKRLYISYQRIEDLHRLPLVDRVARQLLDRTRIRGAPLVIEMRQAELAEAMSASRVSISKALTQLEGEGLVRPGYASIQVMDRKALQRWLEARSDLPRLEDDE